MKKIIRPRIGNDGWGLVNWLACLSLVLVLQVARAELVHRPAANPSPAADGSIAGWRSRVSYGIAAQLAKFVQGAAGPNVDVGSLAAAIRDAAGGRSCAERDADLLHRLEIQPGAEAFALTGIWKKHGTYPQRSVAVPGYDVEGFLTQVFFPMCAQCALSQESAATLRGIRGKAERLVGRELGMELQRWLGKDVDLEKVSAGLVDPGLSPAPDVTGEDLKALVRNVKARVEKENRDILAKANAIFEENKKNRNIEILPGGLQYEVLRPGHGPSPVLSDTVHLMIRGKFITGERSPNGKITLPCGGRWGRDDSCVKTFVPGLKQALQLMTVGAKWRVFLPADLAYASYREQVAHGNWLDQLSAVPDLPYVFELELLAIN